MARDKDKKYTRSLVPFTCPRCGRTTIMAYSNLRTLCPECRKEENRVKSRERAQCYNAILREKNEALKPVASKPKVTEEDKAYRKQKKQCKHCQWWRSAGDVANHCCHYYLIHGVGHRRDPGNGPGDCHSFEPKKKMSRKELCDEARKLLERIEAESYAQQPRSEDGKSG